MSCTGSTTSSAKSGFGLEAVGGHSSSHIFISYRHSDTSAVDDLVQALGEAYPVWRDTVGIRAGQLWREQIARAIDTSYAMILVVSPDTEHSKEVYAEYFYAQGRKVPVVPVLVSEGRLPFDLGAVHALRWHVDQDVALRELKGSLDYHRARHVPTRESVSEEHTFLRALQLAYLLYVENYTRMAGVVHRGFREAPVQPRAVVMRSSFSLRRSGPLFRGGGRERIPVSRATGRGGGAPLR
jgi:hypothetical protein